MPSAALLSGDEREIVKAARALEGRALETERSELARAAEDPGKPLEERLRAGLALSLIGDPRIGDEPLVITLPPGSATVGTPLADVEGLRSRYPTAKGAWFLKETPRHLSHVQVFALAKYPVTNQEYARFVADAGYAAPSWWQGAEPAARYRNHPVHDIAWGDAVAYCRWLTVRTGRVYRLPDEREWEKAARGGDDREFPWGSQFDASRANTREAQIGDTTPIGGFGAAGLGFFDLAGNAEEWTNSWFRLYDGSAADPGDYVAETRVTRGGSFALGADAARCARRHGPYTGTRGIGFRLVRSLTGR
ncbi:MAG TPA: SUMF1/EgtB/PvdO family nonheme iron enzyme [Candidatus Limnocylindria bacterium]|nr:SUMF1/EgtB/PvdO family nonheme iron enzyme [Candidatus Limnocylindria bacterium]